MDVNTTLTSALTLRDKVFSCSSSSGKGVLAYLEEHVSGFDPPVSSHGSPLHDGADVDAPVAPIVALAHDADAQKVVLLCPA